MDRHAAVQNLVGVLVVRALLFLGEVVADDRGLLVHDPLGRFPGQERRVVPPGRIGGLMPLGPVGAKQQYAPGLDRDPLLRQRRLRPLHVLRCDARPGLTAERQVQHHRRAHQRLQRKLLHRRHVPEEMVRRIDVGARVNGHLHKVGDEPLLFPVDDGLDLEVGLVGSERSRIALLYGHAEIDDAHGKGPFPQDKRLVACNMQIQTKMRRIFCCRQGATTSSGDYHARRSNAADDKKD